jgi:hypothetical protein
VTVGFGKNAVRVLQFLRCKKIVSHLTLLASNGLLVNPFDRVAGVTLKDRRVFVGAGLRDDSGHFPHGATALFATGMFLLGHLRDRLAGWELGRVSWRRRPKPLSMMRDNLRSSKNVPVRGPGPAARRFSVDVSRSRSDELEVAIRAVHADPHEAPPGYRWRFLDSSGKICSLRELFAS